MKKYYYLISITLTIFFSSCALNYTYTYQPNANIKGKVILLPTSATKNTYVTLNDSLVLEQKFIKSLTLENLPDGDYRLHFSSYNNSYEEKLDEKYFFSIENGNRKVQLVAVPPASSGFWVWAGLVTSILYMPYFLGN